MTTRFRLAVLSLVLLSAIVVLPAPALAGENVFVNLTSSEPERAGMALGFAHGLLKDGHAVTIFLNLDGAMLGSTKASGLAEQHKTLEAFIKDGGKVLICPHCMQVRKIAESDLIKGVSSSGGGRAAFIAATRSISY